MCILACFAQFSIFRPNIIRIQRSIIARRIALMTAVITIWTYFSPAVAMATIWNQRVISYSLANERNRSRSEPAFLRELNKAEARKAFGSGLYRNRSSAGKMPWWRFYKNVNMVNGNLNRAYADLIYPSRGMSISMVRTYNTNDDPADIHPDRLRVCPFGRGWSFSYDIQLYADPNDPTIIERQTATGSRLPYQVDADGLLSPAVYVHDKSAATARLLRIANSEGGYTDSVLKYDLEGNRLDNETIASGEGNEFFLEFTREGKDGGKTMYSSFERLPGGDPTGYYKATRIEDRYGNAIQLTYGQRVDLPGGKSDSLITQIEDTVGRITRITWTNQGSEQDPYWRIALITDPLGRQWSYNYTTVNAGTPVLARVTTPANRSMAYTYTTVTGQSGGEDGLLSSETTPMGRTTRYTYRVDRSLVSNGEIWVDVVTEPGGYQWRTVPYTPPGGPFDVKIWRIEPVLSGSGISLSVASDPVYRRINWTAYALPVADKRFWVWDNAFHLKSAYQTFLEVRNTFDTVFDENGNVIEPGQGNVVACSTVHSDGTTKETTSFTYYGDEKFHQRSSTINPLGHRTTEEYFRKDDLNQGNRGNLWKSTNPRGGMTEFSYNQYGQKTSMRNAERRTWTYAYNTNGDLTKTTWPDGTFTETAYDPIGRSVRTRDRKGNVTSISYSSAGQVSRIAFADSTSIEYAYNEDDQAISVMDSRGTTSHQYDASTGRLLSITDPVIGTISYRYDSSGARTHTTLPNGMTYVNTYDYQNAQAYAMTSRMSDVDLSIAPQVVMVTDPWGYKTSLSYDNSVLVVGLLSQIKHTMKMDTSGNPILQVQTDITYDGKGRMNRIKSSQTGRSRHLLGHEYDYDTADNRLHMYDIDANNNRTSTESYTYDELSQLTSVTYKDNKRQLFSFDKVGNRLSLNDNGNLKTYTYNSVNELTADSDGSYSYDPNGNTLSDPHRTYSWDIQNRLTRCRKGSTLVNFGYRCDGMRARKHVVGGLTVDYIYDGQTVVGEKRSDGKSVWYMPGVYGYNNRTVINDATGAVLDKEWFLYDGLGSARAMVRPSADGRDVAISARMDYDVFGKTRSQSGNTDSKFRYVAAIGHPTDDETGLIYMRARYYDPGVGRFVSEDPHRNGSSWYWYADGNPIMGIDRTGAWTEWQHYWLGLFMAALAVIYAALGAALGAPPASSLFGVVMFHSLAVAFAVGAVYHFALALGATEEGARTAAVASSGSLATTLSLILEGARDASRLEALAGRSGMALTVFVTAWSLATLTAALIE